jgi:hypothetical protein
LDFGFSVEVGDAWVDVFCGVGLVGPGESDVWFGGMCTTGGEDGVRVWVAWINCHVWTYVAASLGIGSWITSSVSKLSRQSDRPVYYIFQDSYWIFFQILLSGRVLSSEDHNTTLGGVGGVSSR